MNQGKKEGKNQLVTMKTNVTPVVRNDRMQDKDWVVVPMVMLVEGVHNGSCGALYYPKEELEKTPQSWNAKPVVVYHPDGPTACDPDILTNRAVGMIMNTKFEEGKLKAEAWLDPVRMEKVDKRIAEAIEKKVVMELSTGLFTDIEGPEGEWGTEKYDAVAKNYRPDHLALLPDMTGACSVADGAGFLRLNSEQKKEKSISDSWASTFFPFLQAAGIDTSKLTANELSHNEIWRQLQNEIEQKQPKTDDGLPRVWHYVTEVYPEFFVYEAKDKLFKQAYSVKDDKVSLNGMPEEVVRVVLYKTVTNENTNKKGTEMDKKSELIQKLTSNELSGWTDKDKDVLNSMTEDQLNALIGKIPEKKIEAPKTENKEEKKEEKTENVEKKPVVNAEPQKVEDKKILTTEEFIASAPKEIQNVLSQGIKAYNVEKEKLIGTITANPQNSFSKEFLATKDIEELRGLAKLAASAVKPDNTVQMFNYSGQADPVTTTNGEVEVLELPALNFETK